MLLTSRTIKSTANTLTKANLKQGNQRKKRKKMSNKQKKHYKNKQAYLENAISRKKVCIEVIEQNIKKTTDNILNTADFKSLKQVNNKILTLSLTKKVLDQPFKRFNQ